MDVQYYSNQSSRIVANCHLSNHVEKNLPITSAWNKLLSQEAEMTDSLNNLLSDDAFTAVQEIAVTELQQPVDP